MFNTPQMTDLPAEKQAAKAIRHALLRIADHPVIAYHCGFGSQTYALLTEAHATLHGITMEKAQENFPPAQPKELEPGQMRECPFCGGNYLDVKVEAYHAFVHCGDCDIAGPQVDNNRGEDPTQNAVDKWNGAPSSAFDFTPNTSIR